MFHDLVRQARTIRRYDQGHRIEEKTLLQLVDMARVSPCGANAQPLRYRIVFEEPMCERIFPHVAWAGALKDWDGPAEGERPAAYIVILATGNPATNVGIAAQTIQLGAASMGIGACMMGAIQREDIHNTLALPQEYRVQLVIALGRPAETVVLEEVSAGANLDYYRSPDEVHHVPKLRLEDVLV